MTRARSVLLALTCSTCGCAGSDKGESPCASLDWYADADGDGFGDPTRVTEACDALEGTVSDGTDCDDGDANVFPGATERCGDGVVNDCDDVDGAAAQAWCSGSGPFDLDVADAKLLGAVEDALAGRSLADAGDVDADGWGDVLVGAQENDPGRVYVVSGPLEGTSALRDATAILSGVGIAAASAGDQDGDGYDDVVTGSYSDARAYLWLGPVSGKHGGDKADTQLSGAPDTERDLFGWAVTGPGDTDGDGLDDVLIGAPSTDGAPIESELGACPYESEDSDEGPGMSAGAAYLFLSPASATLGLADAEATLTGEDAGDDAGIAMTPAGDLDGDGLADLALSAPGNCEGGVAKGAIYVVLSPVSGEWSLADADGKRFSYYSTYLGNSMDLGDVNGDGTPDFLASETGYDDGEVYLILGPVSGSANIDGPGYQRSPDAVIVGLDADSHLEAVASPGDLDLDGADDVVVGAPGDEGDDYDGVVYLFHGPLDGTLACTSADARFRGTPGSGAGYAVAAAGDVDADGLPDVLVGGPGDGEAAEVAGAAWLLLGGGALSSGTGAI